jgi:hypothetical protein
MQRLDGGEPHVVVSCAEGDAFNVNAPGIYYLPCGGEYEHAPVHVFDPASGRDRVVATLDHLDIGDETDLTVSPDGSTFLYTRLVNEERGADLWMLENFR